jgi:hypothetical protein
VEPYLHSPIYLCGIYRDSFTLLGCIELPYALHLADGSKMEHNVGLFMRFVKEKKDCESGNRYCVLSVESVCLRLLFGPCNASSAFESIRN